VGCPRSVSCERSWEHERCGCTQFVWVADVGWTHRASSPPGGRKACRRHERALAGKRSVAPPDAGRGWAEGESVRVCRISYKSSWTWPAGFGLQVLDTMEGVLGLMPVLLSPAGRRRVPLALRSTPDHHPQGAWSWTADRAEIGFRLGCAWERRRERQRSTRCGEGSSRTEKAHGESASSAPKKALVSEVRRIAIG
jgi:hypothetical protein